jgi:hypothetical protein
MTYMSWATIVDLNINPRWLWGLIISATLVLPHVLLPTTKEITKEREVQRVGRRMKVDSRVAVRRTDARSAAVSAVECLSIHCFLYVGDVCPSAAIPSIVNNSTVDDRQIKPNPTHHIRAHQIQRHS